VPLKKAGNPQESYKMDEIQKNSLGIGFVVGSVMFMRFTGEYLDHPPDLVVPWELGLAPDSVHQSSVT